MKKNLLLLVSILICLGLFPAHSQPGPGGAPGGPNLNGPLSKLFGDNKTFSAALEMQTTDGSGSTITMPGKLSYDSGKSRFEFNLADMKGGKMSANAATEMKAMGLDQMVAISLPDKKATYLLYPGLQSCVEVKSPETAPAAGDYNMDATEIGKETVDGHPCVKNKVLVSGKDGVKHESTVWNATDLKNFPLKIQTTEQGRDAIMLFKNVSLASPPASQFELPSDYKKYDNMQTLMQTEMMKHMGGGMMGGGMGGGTAAPPH